ncbi:unnamed protein product [Caenorhabditis angaria]|uniref:Uncharacterized protein n=1 Tax=Caenorhabditis angaria TaxID=860376 RepID=A0A9P1MUN5_9PELO|nr:unnamed protein product [Caenorhabditis angaria]
MPASHDTSNSGSHISTNYLKNETSFPPQSHSRTPSMVVSERMGAFSEMRHTPSPSRQESSVTPSAAQRLRVDMSSSNSSRSPQKTETPILPSSSAMSNNPFPRGSQTLSSTRTNPRVYLPDNRSSTNSQRPLLAKSPVRFETDPRYHNVPAATYSQADSTDSRRRPEKISDVYSQSGDTVEFAKNLSDYINDKIPYAVSITILSILSLLAFLMIIFGILNLPFCALQPMIPIWLVVAGILFIISSAFRIYFLIPTPKKTQIRRQQRKLGASLLCKGIEVLFLIANLVWLILGCVWTYGSKTLVSFQEGIVLVCIYCLHNIFNLRLSRDILYNLCIGYWFV